MKRYRLGMYAEDGREIRNGKSDLFTYVQARILRLKTRNPDRWFIYEVKDMSVRANIDWANPVILSKLQFRNGDPHNFIRVLCTDAPAKYPVKILTAEGTVAGYTLRGGFFYTDEAGSLDLVPIPKPPAKPLKRTVYISEYGLEVLNTGESLSNHRPHFTMEPMYKNVIPVEITVQP